MYEMMRFVAGRYRRVRLHMVAEDHTRP